MSRFPGNRLAGALAVGAPFVLGACSGLAGLDDKSSYVFGDASTAADADAPPNDATAPVQDATIADAVAEAGGDDAANVDDASSADVSTPVEAGPALNCGPGTFVNGSVCAACPSGTFSNVSDAPSCTAWATCAEGQYVTAPGTSTADRACTNCAAGTYSSGVNIATCTGWTACAPGQYVSVAGSASRDQTCSPCASGSFSSNANAASCAAWSTCAAGQYVVATGSSTTDRACANCGAGTYSLGANAASCVTWTMCGPGQFAAVAGSATVNRVCSACVAGSYSTTANASACMPWTSCAPGSYVSAAGSASTDRACAACAIGTYTTTTNASSCIACPAGSTGDPSGGSCQRTIETAGTTAAMSGDGLDNCGPGANEICARSLLVPGGTVLRGTGTTSPATVGDVRLDKYEITVGRFRRFVDAWLGGWRPLPGDGKHHHLNGGLGLAVAGGAFEPGWDGAWSAYVGAPHTNTSDVPAGPGAGSRSTFDSNLAPFSSCAWTSAPRANERRPMNCGSWYDLQAFCIWDGGFLPSEAEWEYAASGGSDERAYPWGSAAPLADTSLVVFGCYYGGTGTCTGVGNIAPVGSVAAGSGRWGQLDLAGNVWEWSLDGYQAAFLTPCADCAIAPASSRMIRGGGFDASASLVTATSRSTRFAAQRNTNLGARCARPPSGGTRTPESNAGFCVRTGAVCGSKADADYFGVSRTVASCGACGSGDVCSAQNACNAIAPQLSAAGTTATLTGDGLSNCGEAGTESCGTSIRVTGGTYFRGIGVNSPATVSDFRLDKYEVTVGRFRKFVDAWVGGWRPSAGAGKHAHLNGGSGLVSTTSGFEPGWDGTWTPYLGASNSVTNAVVPTGAGAVTKADWDASLSCAGSYTWTSSPGANERRPVNCVSWYDLAAFCIWDGGFLPSEAEWEYAAAGGAEERLYPWGTAPPGPNASLAIYGCYWNGPGPGFPASPSGCTNVMNVAPVGSALGGAGRWGHLDLAGGMFEWNQDATLAFASPCTDCINVSPNSPRSARGSSFEVDRTYVPVAYRTGRGPATRIINTGGRCARAP